MAVMSAYSTTEHSFFQTPACLLAGLMLYFYMGLVPTAATASRHHMHLM